MSKPEHQTKFRKDYQPSPFIIDKVDLTFQLDPEKTKVTATSKVLKNPNYTGDFKDLVLDGEDLFLFDIAIDESSLENDAYDVDAQSLTIFTPPDAFILTIKTEINPESNKTLSGLYRSSNNYCTQCEAEGFRRITYYLDRPDVLAKFTTRIEADKDQCPVLLANGNCIDKGDLANNFHFAVWEDPFPKPCYLFALVAGELVSLDDKYTTRSGREVSLEIYVEPRNKDKCEHAMVSLKKAMKWDEEVYGLEYDLDIYMIVAVDDFNMGAMENKGLNIFNSKYVLASPDSATDQDYLGIEGVIAHEYFHNWSGNRVTCRDWFQLSLKEGLTVFRDQEFSADMNSRPVKRVQDVKVLRNAQFCEDASPMAHPVRPDSYVEINNFYTMTVYNKGAEVIRMLKRIIGDEAFYKGMELYFSRHDGKAVTCDDFVEAMADASGTDLHQFKHWYSQAGTPELKVVENWDESSKKYLIQVEQSCPPTPGQVEKQPFHIPVDIGLLHTQRVAGESSRFTVERQDHHYLDISEKSHQFEFTGFTEKPVLSFLRDFTAPVRVSSFHSRDELALLMSQDENLYNRWEAAFQLSVDVIMDVLMAKKEGNPPVVDSRYVSAFAGCLNGQTDFALIAEAITLPTDSYIIQYVETIEPDLIYESILEVRKILAEELRDDFKQKFIMCKQTEKHSLSPESMARRKLKNVCLGYLMTPEIHDEESLEICLHQVDKGTNMTDVIAALAALSHLNTPVKEKAFNSFYDFWKDDPLVIDKWLILQATSSHPSTLKRVKNLQNHESFSIDNPNKVRSLIGSFCSMNHYRFHDQSGEGYRFLTEKIKEIDPKNPQIAARLITPMTSFRNYSNKLKVMMEEQLSHLLMQPGLSKNVYEIVKKSLDN